MHRFITTRKPRTRILSPLVARRIRHCALPEANSELQRRQPVTRPPKAKRSTTPRTASNETTLSGSVVRAGSTCPCGSAAERCTTGVPSSMRATYVDRHLFLSISNTGGVLPLAVFGSASWRRVLFVLRRGRHSIDRIASSAFARMCACALRAVTRGPAAARGERLAVHRPDARKAPGRKKGGGGALTRGQGRKAAEIAS